MGLNVSAITNYVAANEKQLLAKAILMGDTSKLLNFQPGVKGSANINLLTVDPTIQAGACGWSNSGTSTVSKRTIVTGQMKVNQAFCDKDLLSTSLSYDVKVGVGEKKLPFEEMFIQQNVDAIQAKLEQAIWMGSTGATGATGAGLEHFDGYVTILGATGSGAINATGATALSIVANAKTVVETVIDSIPASVITRDDNYVFVGVDVYRALTKALVNANLYHYPVDGAVMEFKYPGTNVTVKATAGLTAKKFVVASPLSNLIAGGDMLSDSEKFKFWYSEDNSEFRLKVEYNFGVQVAFPDLAVIYKGA